MLCQESFTRGGVSVRRCATVFALGIVFILATGLVKPIPAQEALEIFRQAILVPQCVGLAMTDANVDTFKDRISLAGSIGRDSYLTKNGYHLARVNTSYYRRDRLLGSLIFEDALGRRVHKAYTIDYGTSEKNRWVVHKAKLIDITPLIPNYEVYFIPAEKIAQGKMRTLRFPGLLAYARANAKSVSPDAVDTSPRSYHVMVFAMDRLHPQDGWDLFMDETAGRSWGKAGWRVAATTARFAINGPEEMVFRIFYTPGKGYPGAGRIYAVGAFTNCYQPDLPAGPTAVVEAPPELQVLKSRFTAKALPNLKKD
jgi:hypothetical protein